MSAPSIGPTGLRIVKLLVGRPPQTVADLIRATKVTRTAVAEQLDTLMKAGFVKRAVQRASSRGRPRHLYQATDAAMALLFPGNQQLMAPALWQAIFDVGGERLTKRILKRVTRTMTEHYRHRITAKKPVERLRQLLALFAAEGMLHELVQTQNGRWTIHKRSCPFICMIDDRHSVCRIDQQMMTAVVGHPVRRTACRHDGAPCCTFEIAAK
jgi:DeoR family transcriptional regulator, suf operon transcriptional repressor